MTFFDPYYIVINSESQDRIYLSKKLDIYLDFFQNSWWYKIFRITFGNQATKEYLWSLSTNDLFVEINKQSERFQQLKFILFLLSPFFRETCLIQNSNLEAVKNQAKLKVLITSVNMDLIVDDYLDELIAKDGIIDFDDCISKDIIFFNR